MKTILLVEDDLTEQGKALKILKNLGYQVETAISYIDGLEILNEFDGKLIGVISDLYIPEFNVDVANEPMGLCIVDQAASKSLPVVVCSSIDFNGAADFILMIEDIVKNRNYFFTKIPFIMDSKDWQKAGEELNRMIKEKEEN